MRRYGVDAAILYSDIVVPVAALGFGVEISPGVGPVVERPFRSAADLDRLGPFDPDAHCPWVQETVRAVVGELGDVPLIGFAGAPFTVASYLIEGGPSRTLARTKALMLGEPELWALLLDRLAAIATAALRAQVEAGASAVQLFDSWAGTLSPDLYERAVLPASARVFAGLADLGVPAIHFGVTTGELLPLLAKAGAQVVGVDWRVPLDEARQRLGPDVAVQGNLDPAVCLAPWPAVEERARDVLGPQRRASRPHLQPRPRGAAGDRPRGARASGRAGPRLGGGHVNDRQRGLVVMAYGTPASPDDVEAYYTHIRRGRAPSTDQLAELTRRYAAIGGVSPLAERTRDQVAAIATALNADGSERWAVAQGNKHAPPFVEEAVAELAGSAPDHIVGLVLAPHYSRGSVREYHERAAAAAGERGLAYVGIDAWHDEPAWLDAQADRVRAALSRAARQDQGAVHRPQPPGAGAGRRRPVPRPAAGLGHRHRRACRAGPLVRLGAGMAVGWPHARALARTGRAGRDPRPGRHRTGRGRAGVPPGVRVRPSGGAVRPRHRRPAGGHGVGPGVRPHGVDQRRPRGDGGTGRAGATRGPRCGRRRRARRRPYPVTPRVDLAVVGGGISGLAAAWAGMQQGADVVVLEAGDSPGGKLRTSAIAGMELDEGADAFLARVPEAVDLCEELGLGDELVSPATGAAYVWIEGALRRLPSEQLLGVPTDLDAVEASGILTAAGVERARADLTAPDDRPTGDEAIGTLVRRRLGDEVLDRLVAPLLGGIWAGDCDRLSLRVAATNLAAARDRDASLVRGAAALRAEAVDHGIGERPVFLAPRGGVTRLVDALAERLGERLRCGCRVVTLEPDGAGWRLASGEAGGPGAQRHPAVRADRVVLATPAYVTAPLLAGDRAGGRRPSSPPSTTPRWCWRRWSCLGTASTTRSTDRGSWCRSLRGGCSPPVRG